MRESGKEFLITDLYLAAAVSLLTDEFPEYKNQGERILFIYPNSDALQKAMTDFNNGVEINAFEFTSRIKRLRSEMLLRKNSSREGRR